MDPLSITASIIAIVQATSAVVTYLNDVKDAPKDRARFAIEASNLSTLLISLKYQIEEGKSNDAWCKEVCLLGLQGGPFDQHKHALEKLQSRIVKSDGLAKIGDALRWKFSKEEVSSIISRIERLKSLIQIAMQMDHLILSEAIKASVDKIYSDSHALRTDMSIVRNQIPALQNSADEVQRDRDRHKHQKLVEWISSANFSAQQSDLIGRRQKGTGQWFIESPEFNKWLCGPSGVLFCPGIPGAGKTMISAIAIDYLHREVQSENIGVAQVFCNYKTQSDQNAASLLSAILKQVVQERPYITEEASSLYQRLSNGEKRPALDDIFSVLKSTLRKLSTLYVVVDALDECSHQGSTRSELLSKLRELRRDADVRLMVTSRFIGDIESEFNLMPRLEIRASAPDVKQFVKGQIHRLPKCVQRDDELQGDVEDRIVAAVDGMFLLARLHVDSLLDKRTKAKVQSTLKTLPKGLKALDEAYGDALKRIEAQLPDDSSLAKTVLSWITYARRPLTTGELCHALAVDPDETDLDRDNILDVEDIVSVCAGLVIVDEKSDIIRLVHYTTQDYFVQIRQTWNPDAQRDITESCLAYLSFDSFRRGSCVDDKQFEDRLESYKFLRYASNYWGWHAQTVQEQILKPAKIFLQDRDLISCAVQAMPYEFTFDGYTKRFPTDTTTVHLIARFPLEYLLERLLLEPDENISMLADSKDGYSRTPLSWAAAEGHEAVVKLLIERDDVNADSKDNVGLTPLFLAAMQGHEAVVKLLIERDDVETDLKDIDGQTPLSWAAKEGHYAVVKLLIERDDVNADSKDNFGWTPLSWAARKGHKAVVKLLIERDDVNADSKDNVGLTPLLQAAMQGHYAVVKLLIERDDVNADSKDDFGQTPLSWAAMQGHKAVVKLLIERDDVETDLKDIDGQTPLSWAAKEGHYAVVKLLVECNGVEADSKDGRCRTPLSWAAKEGHHAVVKLLVERNDVEADSKDIDGRTPLSRATEMGHEAIIKLLEERRSIKTDSEDNYGQTEQSTAAKYVDESIV